MNEEPVSFNDMSLWKAANSIRWFIQDRSFVHKDFMEKPDGDLLLSSVESVFITDGMLTTFIANNPPLDDFARDLWFWGAIQALVVQQDAIIHIGKALKKSPASVKELSKLSPDLERIRELRNRTAGHPMVDNTTNKVFTFPARHEGKTYTFLLFDKNSTPPLFEEVDMDMCELPKKQQTVLTEIANGWRKELMNAENDFRKEHATPKLAEFVSCSNYKYLVSNLYLELPKPHLSSAKQLKELISKIAKKFEEKNADGETLSEIIESITYPIDELIRYFESNSHLNEKDIPIFNGFLYAKYDEILELAQEIDQEFEKRFLQ